jgi:hypothetical protein
MLTFKDYILNNNTKQTNLYNEFLYNTIMLLPNKVTSSTNIYNIIKEYTNNNTFKIYQDTYKEYFVYKIRDEIRNQINNEKIENNFIER